MHRLSGASRKCLKCSMFSPLLLVSNFNISLPCVTIEISALQPYRHGSCSCIKQPLVKTHAKTLLWLLQCFSVPLLTFLHKFQPRRQVSNHSHLAPASYNLYLLTHYSQTALSVMVAYMSLMRIQLSVDLGSCLSLPSRLTGFVLFVTYIKTLPRICCPVLSLLMMKIQAQCQ